MSNGKAFFQVLRNSQSHWLIKIRTSRRNDSVRRQQNENGTVIFVLCGWNGKTEVPPKVVRLRGCLHGRRKILALGRSEKEEKLFVCFTCRNFGYQMEKEKKNNCWP